MADLVATLVLVGHFGLLALLSIFGLYRLHLVGRHYRLRNRTRPPPKPLDELPWVTVQIPLYNEPAVARRIIDAVASLDYPRSRFEIQVLDDSTDETSAMVRAAVRAHRAAGIRIEQIQRRHREGFKAGALAEGLRRAKGEFVAIFDADFVPKPDVLRRAIHEFSDPEVGVVQMRWEHLNRGSSALTQIQAIRLDAHFGLEQEGRARAGLHLNFNGTAGIWRAATIRDAGGWQGDTLTEDLDLSYRAQLKGWRFVFRPDLVCPAELPEDYAAFRSQQHRWAKGATQVLRKLLGRVWRSHEPLRQKVETTFHLSANLAYLVMILHATLFLVPSLVVRDVYQIRDTLWIDLPVLFFSSATHLWFFVTGQRATRRRLRASVRFLPALISIGIGLAVVEARACAEALLGRRSEFVRTPKRGGSPQGVFERAHPIGVLATAPEWFLALGFGVALGWAAWVQLWGATPFLLALHLGFLSSAWLLLRSRTHDVSSSA
ncbi:MAG: glycosyltransferase [Myxococcota bacterium]